MLPERENRVMGLNGAAARSIPLRVNARFRPLTPKLRADHVATLTLLGRGVLRQPRQLLQWRKFVVVSLRALA